MSIGRPVVLAALLAGITATFPAAAQAPAPPAASVAPPLPRTLFPQRPQLPGTLVPHELHPDAWPQPDYFSEALKLTDFTPQERYRTLKLRRGALTESTRYIVLPVQSQGFALSPEFRALVAAELDRLLADGKFQATTQTDVSDAYGPFVRRFESGAISTFAAEHPAQKLLGLYLGHDGVDSGFVDLTIGDGGDRRVAHKRVQLPVDPVQAFQVIARVLPGMFAELGLVTAPSSPPSEAFACGEATWSWPELPSADNAARACQALAVGALLPVYDTYGGLPGFQRMLTPAHMAWLARAYVIAVARDTTSPVAHDVGELALGLLGLTSARTSPVAQVGSPDPVVSRVAKLLSLYARIQANPAASSRELFERTVDEAARGLPPSAEALFHARADFSRPFSLVDRCSLDRSYPGVILQNSCGERDAKPGPGREPSAAEFALYQDWRIAAAYKDAVHQGKTLGRADEARQLLAAMPADIAAHPFVQRLEQELSAGIDASTGSDFDAILERTRQRVRLLVQTTVNLQRLDTWFAGNSLTDHTWSKNSNITFDPQVRRATSVEERLLSVMDFDRYVPPLGMQPRRRQAGSPAVFLEPGPWQPFWRMLASAPPMPVAPPVQASAPVGPPPVAYKPKLFAAQGANRIVINGGEGFESLVADSPMTMEWRAHLAVERLQAGASIADAVRLINERPDDKRLDSALNESHEWALPGHVFFLSGEIAPARPFYDKVRRIGSGSESDLVSRIRLDLIDGRVDAALAGSQSRLARYGSDTARRDVIGLLFLKKQPALAWTTFLERAPASDNFQPWLGAAVGHRMESATLQEIKSWIATQRLDRVQIDYRDAGKLYLHLMAVVDRLPQDADIALLREPGTRGYVEPVWGLSAMLARAALGKVDAKEAYAKFKAAAPESANGNYDFMLPLYVWIAGQAAPEDDPYLEMVRQVDIKSDFDRVLAKSMLLALEGKTAESLKYLRSARYAMALQTWSEYGLPGRPIPVEYQYALAAHVMHLKTGEAAYRAAALDFVRNRERAAPASSWPHAVAALIETDTSRRNLAACRARTLDPGSYFLSLAPSSATGAKCPNPLW